MSELKQKVINSIIAVEGGYVNDPSDSGGKTKYGITERVARTNGYKGDMRDLPKSLAFEIYSKMYWDNMKLDDIEKIAPKTAEKMADIGINAGTSRASKFLQQSLNALNYKNEYGNNLRVDGKIGPATLLVLKKYIKHRGKEGDEVLRKMLNGLQASHYIRIANKYPKNKKFTFGWVDNRVS